ncbi:hypothetical protein CCHL11_04904 [Colletotrichum chlorophyti]|uniref:SH3 domain-containing protein n=1 Tax=Colletotrichum chlorophyti TaxID=708187 RepID=A0A1Q8S2Q9_9PEZI|nr:hypothetical protein CCHL11_04904 [Colletotrichum chlorophyti]
MDVIDDLVTGVFKEVIEKASLAVENAADNRDMLSESQKLVKGAERVLKIIEPLCSRHLEEYGVKFTDALKDDNDIAEYRSQLTDKLWDFDDYIEADTFEKDTYVELREMCKKSGLRIGEILKRMKLEAAQREPAATPIMAALPPAVTVNIQAQTDPATPGDSEVLGPLSSIEPEAKVEEEILEPPPPPTNNPWDLETSPPIDMGLEVMDDNFERRPPVTAMSSPTTEPASPDDTNRLSHSPSRQMDFSVDRMLSEDEPYQLSPQDVSRSPVDRAPFAQRGRTSSTTLTAAIPEDQAMRLQSTVPHRQSQTSSNHSHYSSRRSQDSLQNSILDSRRSDGVVSPAMTDYRASTADQDAQVSPISRPVIPANFPSGIQDGIERVPLVVNDTEGLIPVEAESSQTPRSQPHVPTRSKDCSIGLSSSFYLYKGFCDGAKEVVGGELGIKKIKRPSFSGAQTFAKCSSCSYELDYTQVQKDINNSNDANYVLNRIVFRPRFLQKSHIATKRPDELLFGCVFCVHSQRTLEECDATVFFSQQKLFEHIARHPRPLPRVSGVTVVEEAEIPFNLRNNYDLHLKSPPNPSLLAEKQPELAQLPSATATQTVKRMYGMRLLADKTPAFELANGARIAGIEFPAKYNGEWIMGWHEGHYGSAPVDVLKLEPPPKSEIRMDTTSNISAVARWKFAPKSKGGGDWLKFDHGERITNISWAWQDHWCWSGTNSKGTWGIFPQTHIDNNSIREISDRSSISSSERRKSDGFFGKLTSRKMSQRPPSVAETAAVPASRPSVF